jgi:hypothetical protein
MTYALDIIAMALAAFLVVAVISYDLGHFFGYRKGVREMSEAAANLMSGDDANG